MNQLKNFALALSFAATATTAGVAVAAPAANPLSVHVLDLQSGQPTAGIRVTLEERNGDGSNDWRALAAGVTNAQGRIAALYPEGKTMAAGDYRIVFETGDHFKREGKATFFPRIPVEFKTEAGVAHYHIPLLLSPYGYSTYRGN